MDIRGDFMTNQQQSRYWDDPYEQCMVREIRTTIGSAVDIEVAVKFYGKEELLTDTRHHIYCDVVLSESAAIDAVTYAQGKDRRPRVIGRLTEGALAKLANIQADESADDMDAAIQTFVAEHLKPLGGRFIDRYWPVTAEQIVQIEETVGFSLPDDYRAYVSTTGLATPRTGLKFSAVELAYPIALSVLFGNPPRSNGYSVVALAGEYLQPQPLLKIGQSQGGALYLDEDGAVWYENNKEVGVTSIADSFLEFLTGLQVVE